MNNDMNNNERRDATHAEIQARYDAERHADAVVFAHWAATARPVVCMHCGCIITPQLGERVVVLDDGDRVCVGCAVESRLDV